MTDAEEFPEPDFKSLHLLQYYGARCGLIVTLNARMFWALDFYPDKQHVHLCAGPLEVSAWLR